VQGDVVAALDVNEVANHCYKANFPNVPVLNTSIDHLTLSQLNSFQANVWFLSPPCQPFARGGKALDHVDTRSRGILHLIELLGQLEAPPQFIFLENVLNFEKSVCRQLLVQTLQLRGYEIVECLLDPTCVGIPNSRLRYFLMARWKIQHPNHPISSSLLSNWISESTPLEMNREIPASIQSQWPPQFSYDNQQKSFSANAINNGNSKAMELGNFLEDSVDESFNVPEALIRKSKNFIFGNLNLFAFLCPRNFSLVKQFDPSCSNFFDESRNVKNVLNPSLTNLM
jgi:site-specific DNA-cytosine methylase